MDRAVVPWPSRPLLSYRDSKRNLATRWERLVNDEGHVLVRCVEGDGIGVGWEEDIRDLHPARCHDSFCLNISRHVVALVFTKSLKHRLPPPARNDDFAGRRAVEHYGRHLL